MSRKYNRPPIVETLCEFQFIPGQPWDMTIVGLFYEKIKEEFPEKQQQTTFEIGFRKKEGRVEQKVGSSARMQFLSKDKRILVQTGPDLLVINHLKPYPTWHKFCPMILKNLKQYQKTACPKSFKRIDLRYINKIEIAEKSVELADYFSYYPFLPEKFPQTHEAFNVRIEIPFVEGRDRLLLTLASTPSEKPDNIAFVLDLDYVMVSPEKVEIEEVEGWIEKAHTEIENGFESCITEKCRDLFEEEKQCQ